MSAWFRIDNRLVHGQVIEGWLPYLDAGELVVANDALAGDPLRQQIMQLAIPARVRVRFIPVSDVKMVYETLEAAGKASLFILSDCGDVMRTVEQGVPVPVLNVGNMHYTDGKRQICSHVAASSEDLQCFTALRQHGTKLDFRCVPGDTPMVEEW